MSASDDPKIPEKCPGCSATTVPEMWWCPQCYRDFTSEAAPDPGAARAAVPAQRQTDRPSTDPVDTRSRYRQSRRFALDAALTVEEQKAPRHAAPDRAEDPAVLDALAQNMLADLAAEEPLPSLLVKRDSKERMIIATVATAVLLLLVLGALTLVGLLT